MTSVEHGTAIEWTHVPGYKGETWNPVTGCSKVSPGCAHCYAETYSLRMGWSKLPWTPENEADNVILHPERLGKPASWAAPRAIFVNSMSDLFHEKVPDRFIADVLDVARRTRRHIFMILTKRPKRAAEWFEAWSPAFERFTDSAWPLPNVWLGVSIENSRFTWRADVLRNIPAAVRFVSAEPLLGSLFEDARSPQPGVRPTIEERQHVRSPLDLTSIDWLIVGGESGAEHRPMDISWVRELRDACDQFEPECICHTGTCPEECEPACAACHSPWPRPAFFFKQWGGRTPKAGGYELDGQTYQEWPTGTDGNR